MANVVGTAANDFIHRAGDGRTPPAGSVDIPETTEANDFIDAGLGDDTILAGLGDDRVFINAATDGADQIDLGKGADRVDVDGLGQVRLTFTSAEVGNGDQNDSGALANQDGGLGVRLQAEGAGDALQGPVSRVDDEGITFVAGDGVTFDVRDLVSGAARGDQFEVVRLGTTGSENINLTTGRPTYVNAGLGNDRVVGGENNDFLVGGGGNDTLIGMRADDTFIGGAGDDSILGGKGSDNAIFNVTTDGADQIDLGGGDDVVTVNANAPTQVRLTFTSAEVGNANQNDGGVLNNQDGGLAVRLQAEGANDGLAGSISRVEDEGVTFVGGAGVTFDVRDLVLGAARGDQFEVVTLGTSDGEALGAVQNARPYYINGGGGNDFITDGRANDFLVGGAGNDTLLAAGGRDSFIGGGGDDSIVGGRGADTATQNITTDGADQVNLGRGSDVLNVNANAATEVRLTFTSAEVGNNSATDSGLLANQDGGLAVRMQAEGGSDVLTGPITRTDDEGITYVGGAGVTFDVRDLVSGIARGNQFEVVTLGTGAGDTLGAVQSARPYYINGGAGNDTITDGTANDFLVGGAGNDTLTATLGNDSFIGGGGDDSIIGGAGSDTAILNVTTDGADQIDLGADSDLVNVSANSPGQVRLTFTSAEVGNGLANDSGMLANQDGGLAVRLQAEGAGDTLTGPITRTDDEGVTYVAGAGVTFDVRDLVIGAARGDQFEVVTLGTSADDTLGAVQTARPYYINGGQGADTITDGTANDFLVGGAGNDTLTATLGNDSFIGGGGDDQILGGVGSDVATLNVTTDGADQIDLGADSDIVNVNANTPGQVRLSFTSAEVGNGSPNDSNTMPPNQDGGLAVRLQAEGGGDVLAGPVTRTDDEGITYVAGAGVTFDVRDLVSGAARGDQFEVVTLGTSAADTLGAVQNARPYYINGGQGADTITDGTANDFLVGGAGNDTLTATVGNDSFIGGGGDDQILGGGNDDTAIHNITTDGADQVNLEDGSDVMTVNANAAGQVRLTFTSAEIGNGSANDSNTMMNQDGGLAVRMQAENGSDGLTGPLTRVDDEGITFVGGTGVTFDVRDLVNTSIQRGDQFQVVTLGTSAGESLNAVQDARPYYINAGGGDDTVSGGSANDFLVGGAGNDTLDAEGGTDSLIGGAGTDTFSFSSTLGAGNVDAILDFAVVDDTIQLDSSVFQGLAVGNLDADAFLTGAAAADAEDRIIYNSSNGALFFDQDGTGSGAAIQFATVTAGLTLTENDFKVV